MSRYREELPEPEPGLTPQMIVTQVRRLPANTDPLPGLAGRREALEESDER